VDSILEPFINRSAQFGLFMSCLLIILSSLQLLLQDGPPALTNDTSNVTDTTNTTDTTTTSSFFPPSTSDSHSTQSTLNNAYPAPPSFEQLIRSDSLMEFAAGMVDDLSGAV
jgi:hypothetical protein